MFKFITALTKFDKCVCVYYKCVFITEVPITKLFAWGEGDSGGHVPRETTSRGLSGLVCPSRTSFFFLHILMNRRTMDVIL